MRRGASACPTLLPPQAGAAGGFEAPSVAPPGSGERLCRDAGPSAKILMLTALPEGMRSHVA